MIVKDFQNAEIEGDDEFEGTDAGIDESNLGFLFDIVSKQMYRRPINSIVREITSNCFDSHIEAKVDDPVLITFGEDEGGYFIVFKDVGIGISPDRMKNIYSKYFSSSKRDTNDQIGMFGLGSKSPLAYNDHFFLTTFSEGIRYEYMIHAGAKIPRIQLLTQEEQAEHNGTEIKIYIKNSLDLSKFIEACESELVYFDNVYIDCKYKKFDNLYKILDYNTFKYRTKTKYSDALHIAIGKVAYPISWSELGIPIIYFPAALKFNIGDLAITPERESIRYIDLARGDKFVPTKQIILDKIEEFKREVVKLYKDTKTADEFEDYQEFFKAYNSRKAHLILSDGDLEEKVDITSLVGKPKLLLSKLKDFTGTYPREPLSIFYTTTQEYRRGSKARESYVNLSYSTITKYLCVTEPVAGKMSRKKLDYLYDFAYRLTGNSTFYTVKPKTIVSGSNYNYSSSNHVINILRVLELLPFKQIGITQQYKAFKEFTKSEFTRLSFHYESIDIPEDWLKAWNLAHVKQYNKKEEDILVYDYGKILISDAKTYLNPESLQRFKGFILYGFEENENYLKNFRELLIASKYGSGGSIDPLKCKLYKIAKRNEKHFLSLSNAIHIETFMGNNKIFKRIATAAVIHKKSKAIRLTGTRDNSNWLNFESTMKEAFPPVAEALDKINKACDDYGRVAYTRVNEKLSDEFFEEIVTLAEQYNLYDEELYTLFERLERYVEGLELINYIAFKNWNILPFFVDYLVIKGKKVAPIWTEPTEFEKQLIKEGQDKLSYLVDTYSMKYSSYYYLDGRQKNNTITKNYCDLVCANSRKKLDIYNALTTYHGTKTTKAN